MVQDLKSDLCPNCGQIPNGQSGEYPCPVCDLPQLHDANVADGWIQTFSKKKLYPLNPYPAAICIEDIAHDLAAQNRFTGHTIWPHSVGLHSIHVADQLPPHLKLAGLMHDASEAYLVDLPKPLKVLPEFAAYRAAEARLMEVIAEKYGFQWPLDPLVDKADYRMLATEANQLMAPLHPDWQMKAGVKPYDIVIKKRDAEDVEADFWYRFVEYSNGILGRNNGRTIYA